MPYLSHVLLEHTQLQTLVEAELAVLPRPLHLMMTLQEAKTNVKNSASPPVIPYYQCVASRMMHLHDLVQDSHDAVRGGGKVGLGRGVLGIACRAALEDVHEGFAALTDLC